MNKYRETAAKPYRPGPEFFALADPVVEARRTLLGHDRLYVLWQAARNVVAVDGAAAEVGVFRGGSAYFLASIFDSLIGPTPFHVFDTFTGHPSGGAHDPFNKPGSAKFRVSAEEVRAYLAAFPFVTVHVGNALETVPTLPALTYRLVHVDTDLYDPTLFSLKYFGTRLSPGGVIVVDDYASDHCPGVLQAVTEYLAHTEAFQVWDQRTQQIVLVKVAA